MNARGFGFETGPAAADGSADRPQEPDARSPTRAAPADPPDGGGPAESADLSEQDLRREDPGDEPGYGHGV